MVQGEEAPARPHRGATALSVVVFDPLRDKSYQSTRLGRDVADFLAWHELGGSSPRTLDQYERDLARGALMFPDKGLTDLTDGDLFHIAKRFKPLERRVRMAAWRSFFKWAKRTRRTTFDPTEALPDMRAPRQKVIEVFSEAEVGALLELDVVDAAPLAVLFEAGLRKAEARALRFRHCHPESGQVIVVNGKGGRDRIIPMSARLLSLLASLALTEGLDERDHIFYGVRANEVYSSRQRKTPVGEGTFARWWRRCLDDAGVRYRTPHTARHTFATSWRLRGLAVDEIQILLGHSSIRTTSDLYVHTQVQDVAEHMRVLESLRSDPA